MSIFKELLRVKSFKVFAVAFLATFSLIATVAGLGAVISNDGKVSASGDSHANSIIPGGVNSVSQLRSKYNSLDAKGRAAFANAGVNPNTCSNIVLGATTKDNRVVVGNKTVSSNVYTFGRGYMPGSTQISGGAWMRHPSVSFRSSSIPSYVCMDGGQYKWAVINSCGNPVKGPRPTPPKSYNYTIKKKATKDLNASTNGAYFLGNDQGVNAKKGEIVRFVSMTTNTGTGTLNGALYDKLPAGLTFVSGKWQKTSGGVVVQRGDTDKTGAAWYTLKPGEELKIDVKARYDGAKFLTNVACTKANEIRNPKCDEATVTPPPKPPVVTPSAKCESLTATKLTATNFRFTTRAVVKDGAKIKGYAYDFGDNQTKTVNTSLTPNSVTHSYNRTWKYTVKVTVLTTAGNRVCYAGAHVKVPVPEVRIRKTVDNVKKKQVEIGKDFTYQIRVTNSGEVNLKNVLVGDTAPKGVSLKSESANKGEIFDNGNKWKFTIPELKVGQYMDFNLVGVVNSYKTGELKNIACVNAKEINTDKPDHVDACDDAVVTVVPRVPAVSIDKTVDGVEKKQVEVGKDFTYQLVVKNTGDVDLKNALVYDVAPAGVTLLSADTGEVKEGNGPSRYGVLNGTYWRYTIPELKVGQSMTFNIKAVVNEYKESELKNIACVDAREVNPNEADGNDDCDDAVVTVIEPNKPFVSCDLLSAEQLSYNKFKFTVSARALNGASIRFYTFNFDDGTDQATTDNNMVEHEYASDGEYTASASVTADVNGEDKVVESEDCKVKVSVVTPGTPETPESPETPGLVGKSLPDTGAGDIAGMFFATALAGSIAYRFVWLRRYN